MKFHFYVVACQPHHGLTTMIDVIDTLPLASISIEHVPLRDLMNFAGGKLDPTTNCFLCTAEGQQLRTLRDLFLFIESKALWPM